MHGDCCFYGGQNTDECIAITVSVDRTLMSAWHLLFLWWTETGECLAIAVSVVDRTLVSA